MAANAALNRVGRSIQAEERQDEFALLLERMPELRARSAHCQMMVTVLALHALKYPFPVT